MDGWESRTHLAVDLDGGFLMDGRLRSLPFPQCFSTESKHPTIRILTRLRMLTPVPRATPPGRISRNSRKQNCPSKRKAPRLLWSSRGAWDELSLTAAC